MKKYIFALLLLFFGLVVASPLGSALAYQIVTVTATFIPPSATPTAANFSCPVGTPAGWGTYTPSPLWLMQCSSCPIVITPTGTSTPSPVATWSGTGTPPATFTYTPVSIPSATPTVSNYPPVSCGSNTSSYLNCVQINSSTVKYSYKAGSVYPAYPTSFSPRLSYTTTPNISMYLLIDVNSISPSGVWQPVSGLNYWHYKTSGAGLDGFNLLRVDANTSSTVNYYSTVSLMADGYTRTEALPIGEYSKSYPAGSLGVESLLFSAPYQPNWSGFYIYDGADIYISSLPVVLGGTATPVPTQAVFDTGFCASVSPVVDGFGFDLFIPDGEPNCSMGWDEFGVGDYTIPAAQICLQPSQFGVIRLFGSDYEIGIYALAAAAAFYWRYFRTV